MALNIRNPETERLAEALARETGETKTEAVTKALLIARRAFGRFGKGRHRAGLNYGDCFSYALASVRNEPLLFKGDDFGHTDIAVAFPMA
jgi:ribonuclease VapC